jgi:hypothetical protein
MYLSCSIVAFYMYDLDNAILYEIMLNFYQNWLLNLMLHAVVICSVLSVNTGTGPKIPIPNFLDTELFYEPINSSFLWNRICMGKGRGYFHP